MFSLRIRLTEKLLTCRNITLICYETIHLYALDVLLSVFFLHAGMSNFTAEPHFEIHKLGSFTLINKGSRLKKKISVHEQCKYKEFQARL